jgi:hypothetical protein
MVQAGEDHARAAAARQQVRLILIYGSQPAPVPAENSIHPSNKPSFLRKV